MMSGRPIEDFKGGWALALGTWGSAHFWALDGIGAARSLCGQRVKTRFRLPQGGTQSGMMAPGDWKRCARCVRQAPAGDGEQQRAVA